jgi:hypothetical protein
MQIYDKKTLFLVFILMKTGGTSFEEVLKSWFGFGCFKHEYGLKYKNYLCLKRLYQTFFLSLFMVILKASLNKSSGGFI